MTSPESWTVVTTPSVPINYSHKDGGRPEVKQHFMKLLSPVRKQSVSLSIVPYTTLYLCSRWGLANFHQEIHTSAILSFHPPWSSWAILKRSGSNMIWTVSPADSSSCSYGMYGAPRGITAEFIQYLLWIVLRYAHCSLIQPRPLSPGQAHCKLSNHNPLAVFLVMQITNYLYSNCAFGYAHCWIT